MKFNQIYNATTKIMDKRILPFIPSKLLVFWHGPTGKLIFFFYSKKYNVLSCKVTET